MIKATLCKWIAEISLIRFEKLIVSNLIYTHWQKEVFAAGEDHKKLRCTSRILEVEVAQKFSHPTDSIFIDRLSKFSNLFLNVQDKRRMNKIPCYRNLKCTFLCVHIAIKSRVLFRSKILGKLILMGKKKVKSGMD